MRDMGVRGLLIYCADHYCSHSVAMSADAWADDVRLLKLQSSSSANTTNVPTQSSATLIAAIISTTVPFSSVQLFIEGSSI
jgi:hypothetical protein